MLSHIKKRPVHFGVGALIIAITIAYLFGYFTPQKNETVTVNQTIFAQVEGMQQGDINIYVVRYFWGPAYYNSPEKAARSQYKYAEVNTSGRCLYQLFTSASPPNIEEQKKNASYFVFSGEMDFEQFSNRCDYYRLYVEGDANVSFAQGFEGKFARQQIHFNSSQNITYPFLSCSPIYDIKASSAAKIFLVEATMLPCEVTTIRIENDG